MSSKEYDSKRLVAFAILMGADNRVIMKNPAYVMEKFLSAVLSPDPGDVLDDYNKRTLRLWCKKWGKG